MSAIDTIATFVARRNAELVHGTRLGATQFAQTYKREYTSRADELRAKRVALMAKQLPTQPEASALSVGDAIPVPTRQHKLATAK